MGYFSFTNMGPHKNCRIFVSLKNLSSLLEPMSKNNRAMVVFSVFLFVWNYIFLLGLKLLLNISRAMMVISLLLPAQTNEWCSYVLTNASLDFRVVPTPLGSMNGSTHDCKIIKDCAVFSSWYCYVGSTARKVIIFLVG